MCRVGQDAEPGDTVFHFLERGKHGLAIVCHGRAVSSLGKIELSPAPASTQYGLGNVGPDRPKRAGSADQVGRIEALNATGAEDIDAGVERTLGHTDLRVL